MPGSCALFKQLKPIMGNNVSHSNQKTKKKFHVNLQETTLSLDCIKQKFSGRISNQAKRTLTHIYGENFPALLVNTKNNKLTEKALKLKKKVLKKMNPEEVQSLIVSKPINEKLKAMKKQPKARLVKKNQQKLLLKENL